VIYNGLTSNLDDYYFLGYFESFGVEEYRRYRI